MHALPIFNRLEIAVAATPSACIANTSIAVAFAVGLRPFYSPFTLAEEDPNTDQCEMKKCHNLANKLKH